MSDDEMPEEVEAEGEDAEADDIEEVEPTIEELLAAAEARAGKAEAEIGYRDADIINMRRRHVSERSEALKYAGFNLSGRIIPVLDSLDLALKDAEEGPFTEGIQLIRENLVQALTAEGVTPIEVGETFDPTNMEALTTMPASDDHPDGAIIDVLETGWMYKDRVLRPARVVVSKE